MRNAVLAASVAALVGCGAQSFPVPPDHRSWSERQADARAHERYAEYEEGIASERETQRFQPGEYNCGDTVLMDQIQTGGRPLTLWTPCFDAAEESAMHHRFLASREREAARADRAGAHQLLRAEIAACQGISPREREHSVFAHRDEISEIVPHYEGAQLHGVWVIFKPVPGMTADWVRQDIACQRARWALQGEPADLAPNDPTLVPNAQVQVADRAGHVEVLISTPATADAEIALARAHGQASPAGEQGATETATRERRQPATPPR